MKYWRVAVFFLISTVLPAVSIAESNGDSIQGNYDYSQQQQEGSSLAKSNYGQPVERSNQNYSHQQQYGYNDVEQQELKPTNEVTGDEGIANEDQPPLPEGWNEFRDPASGRSYYYNAEQRITTWTRPIPPKALGDIRKSTLTEHDQNQEQPEKVMNIDNPVEEYEVSKPLIDQSEAMQETNEVAHLTEGFDQSAGIVTESEAVMDESKSEMKPDNYSYNKTQDQQQECGLPQQPQQSIKPVYSKEIMSKSDEQWPYSEAERNVVMDETESLGQSSQYTSSLQRRHENYGKGHHQDQKEQHSLTYFGSASQRDEREQHQPQYHGISQQQDYYRSTQGQDQRDQQSPQYRGIPQEQGQTQRKPPSGHLEESPTEGQQTRQRGSFHREDTQEQEKLRNHWEKPTTTSKPMLYSQHPGALHSPGGRSETRLRPSASHGSNAAFGVGQERPQGGPILAPEHDPTPFRNHDGSPEQTGTRAPLPTYSQEQYPPSWKQQPPPGQFGAHPDSYEQTYQQQSGSYSYSPNESTSSLKESLGTAWQGVIGFGNRTKAVVDQATESVTQSASQVSETVSATGIGLWGRVKASAENVGKSLFERDSEQTSNNQSLSPYGGPPIHQQQQQYPTHNYGGYPTGHTPPGPRITQPYPHQSMQGSQQNDLRGNPVRPQGPPLQSHLGDRRQQRTNLAENQDHYYRGRSPDERGLRGQNSGGGRDPSQYNPRPSKELGIDYDSTQRNGWNRGH